DLLRRMCQAVGEAPARAEALWHETERQRFLDRGYPAPLAEFWLLCARAGFAEKHLTQLGMSTATVRRLRYLELPDWQEVAKTARRLCRDTAELHALKKLWRSAAAKPHRQVADVFRVRLKEKRKRLGIRRRELADLFGIGGKKPARIVKYIEEDGFYSAQA